MDRSFWRGLAAEDVAEQADLWRYAADRNAKARRYGLARWCRRMEQEALTELAVRESEAREAAHWGDQLAFDIAGRVEPDRR